MTSLSPLLSLSASDLSFLDSEWELFWDNKIAEPTAEPRADFSSSELTEPVSDTRSRSPLDKTLNLETQAEKVDSVVEPILPPQRSRTLWPRCDLQRLVTYLRDNPPQWRQLSQEIFEGRYTPAQCRYKYVRYRRSIEGRHVGRWTFEDNQSLLKLYSLFPDKWETIAANLKNKFSPEACQKHYQMLQYIVPET